MCGRFDEDLKVAEPTPKNLDDKLIANEVQITGTTMKVIPGDASPCF
jgi:hypothetical protein